MELILNAVDFEENRFVDGYSVGGELYFSVQNEFFPAEHWYDCTYLDLKNWLPGLISFVSKHTDFCAFLFMDGPYRIRLTRLPDGAVQAVALREQTEILREQDVSVRTLLKSVLSCCRKYDRFLHENGKQNLFQKEIRELLILLDT